MSKSLTYKNKYYLLLAGLGIACILIYFLAIKKTIKVIAENLNLSEKIEFVSNAPEQIATIEMQLSKMEQLVVDDKQLDFEQMLLERVTIFCQQHKLRLIEFPKTAVSQYQNYKIYTNRIVLEGNFKEMLQFIYEAELKYHTGKIMSVEFKRTKDIRSKQLHLYAYLYFQNIQINSN